MAELFEIAKLWLLGLGHQYGVDPLIFGGIYVGATPLFTLSIVWLVRNYRKEKSILLPSLLSVFFFISAYLYLIIEGENVPWWIYGLVLLMISYGGWTTVRLVRKKISAIKKQRFADE